MWKVLGKDLAVESKKKASLEVKSFNWPLGKEVPSNCLFSKLASFNSLVGMSIEGFEREMFSLVRKMETRKGHGIYVLRGKGKLILNSRLEREI